MRRSDRESTIKKSQALQEKLSVRERNKTAHRAIRNSKSSELVELAPLVGDNIVELETSNNTSSEGEVFDFVSGSEEEYWIDTSGQELTGLPLASPVSPFPPAPRDPETWSVSVNRLTSDSNLSASLRIESLPVSEAELPLVAHPSVNTEDNCDQVQPVIDQQIGN